MSGVSQFIKIIKGKKINEIEKSKSIQNIKESCLFEKVSKVEKPPANLTEKKKKEDTTNIINEKRHNYTFYKH